jgi:hypothetical protein
MDKALVDMYCDRTDAEILEEICDLTVPDFVLTSELGWRRVCQVKARQSSEVKAETWQNLCAIRGDALGGKKPTA